MTRVEIYINGTRADIVNDEIQPAINRTLWDPSKTVTTQAEWSFSFNLPSSATNNKIFQHADILAVNGKYHQRYSAQVYADGILIYDGSLIVNEYDARAKKYNCNLVNIKIDTLEDIFGEEVLTDGEWYVPFSGVPTINSVNADMTSKYFFPIVAYGAFQKLPVAEDEVGKTFTPKHTIDGSNKFWVESFYPSMQVLETVRKLFENKGFNVNGTAYQDDTLMNIYASTNLADEQSPILNVGNQLFGDIELTCRFNNNGKQANAYIQELQYKYEKVAKPEADRSPDIADYQTAKDTNSYDYNFSEILWWNMLQSENSTIQLAHKEYVYDPYESMIVIPADGWYTIRMDANIVLQQPTQTFNANLTTTNFSAQTIEEKNITLAKDFTGITPIEIQLIRNYDDNIELIKGNTNVTYFNGNPNDVTYNYDRGARRWREGGYQNKHTWRTCYPHEDLKNADNPTNKTDLLGSAAKQMSASDRRAQFANRTITGSGERVDTFGTTGTGTTKPSTTNPNLLGYVNHRSTMAYDPAVSEAFICGFSSLSNGTVAVQKDGKSWSSLGTTKFDCIANVEGYKALGKDGTLSSTNLNKNSYNTAGNTNYCTILNGNNLVGVVQCCVYLKKNDLLQLALIEKSFDEGVQKYSVAGAVNLHIKAIADTTKEKLKNDATFNMFSDSRFPTELNLFNFSNSETKKSDWISNVLQAFNLELTTVGNNITINTNKGVKKEFMDFAVDIDDRASSNDAISSRIDYPRSMSVRYRIATGETGFESSVPPEWIDTDEWVEHGDSGYTVVQLSDDAYVIEENNTQTQFSYCWYDTFQWYDTSYPITSSGWTTNDEMSMDLQLPILAESRYFIELPSDEEGMKHDGYSLTQRFWVRQPVDSTAYVRGADINHEIIHLAIPTNQYQGTNLSYKDTEKSILSEFFNFRPLLDSNYVEIETRLTAEEYRALCGGAKVKFDSDIYYVAEIGGYDATGENACTLKLVKKTD